MTFDLIIKNGVVATAADVGKYDIGVKDGKIMMLAPSIDAKDSPKAKVIDAEGAFVTVSKSNEGMNVDMIAWRSRFSCAYQ